jgi:hypothetical protein
MNRAVFNTEYRCFLKTYLYRRPHNISSGHKLNSVLVLRLLLWQTSTNVSDEFSTSFFGAEDWNMEVVGSPETLVSATQKTII